MITSFKNEDIASEIKSIKGFESLLESQNVHTSKEFVKIGTDLELIIYLLDLKQMNNKTLKELIMDFLLRVNEGKENVPFWIKNLIITNGPSLNSALKSDTLYCKFLLKILCFVFKIRLIVHFNDSTVFNYTAYGYKASKSYQVFLCLDGYYTPRYRIKNIMKLVGIAQVVCKKEIAYQNHESNYSNFSKQSKVCQTETLNVKPIIYNQSNEFKVIKPIEKCIHNQPCWFSNVRKNDKSKPSIDKNILNYSNYKQISKNIHENNNKNNHDYKYNNKPISEKTIY